MAVTLAELLRNIPEGDEYDVIAFTLQRIAEDFPDRLGDITPARIAGWISDVDSGVRDEYQIRNDVFQYIVTEGEIMETYGVDAATAQQIIQGELSASEFDPVGDAGAEPDPGDIDITPDSAPPEEEAALIGVGVGGESDDTVSIMTSPSMQWSFDPGTGTWHVSYQMPNSDRRVFFEATGEQMDALFGEGNRPTHYSTLSFEDLTEGQTFAGDITEVSGTGSFESEVDRTVSLALDEGILPSWAMDDPAVMDLVYIAHTEGKSDEWLIEQISALDSFQLRFPGVDELKNLGLSTSEAVQGFLELEMGIKSIMLRQGMDPSALGAEVVGDLIKQGHSLSDVEFVYTSFEKFNANQEALEAFNQVLAERGLPPLSADDQLAFLEGHAPAELYDIWEEASFNEAAIAAGLDISVADAMSLAGRTEGHTTQAEAFSALNNAAANILRYRADLDFDRYGLDQDDLIDIQLGIAPRSGRSAAEISQGMERALQSARAGVDGPRANRFRQFTQEGVPQAVSTSRARAEE